MKSEIYEWIAISQSELGFPDEIIRNSFETAIRLDTGNDRARNNFAEFETAIVQQVKKSWKTRSALAVQKSGLVERRYALVA